MSPRSRCLIPVGLLAIVAGIASSPHPAVLPNSLVNAILAGDEKKPPDEKAADDRAKRVLRWNLVFDTATGEDYAAQLLALGAILAVPEKEDAAVPEYRVFRDLKQRPVKGEIEDVKTIKRIFWVNDNPASVKPLAAALGLPKAPSFVVAFFPEALEENLAKLELAFAQRNQRKVTEIAETRFRVIKRDGKYEVVMVDQRAK
jgi:hypothetical protein